MKSINYSIVILLLLVACSPVVWQTADAKYERYEIADAEGNNAEMTAIVEPYKSQLDAKMNVVIGELDVELIKERVESSIGNWYADIILEEANIVSDKKVDIAMQNYGGIRTSSVPPGPITIRTIYEIMPFENELVTVDIDGVKLMRLLDYLAAYGGVPISKGVKFEISGEKAVNITINDEEIDPKRIYRIALNDYIANGGDNASVFKGAEVLKYDLLQRDAIINHIKRDTENGIIQTGKKEGRIVKIN